ncbi:hypothetical protein [Nitrobacter winogradskyi]|uniref:DNA-binding protein H-NS n=2 Tax=Nitrobacter winogradskyi TaxID=913 RepID=A0ACC6AH87_NITWI|nr:hypothetical protein [Nitrobacter winogradskyi]MCP1999069.1 DNA-binding protein H-NS [Nitrobacter winogradskyi]GEC16782.1 hypothetical protein NWI01_26740 [Nitrobacter winogradskyi]
MSDHSSDRTAGERDDKLPETGDRLSPGDNKPRIAPATDAETDAEAPAIKALRGEADAEGQARAVEVSPVGPEVEVEHSRSGLPRELGKAMVVTPFHDGGWDRAASDHGPAAADGARTSSRFGKRRLAAVAAMAALAAITGAIGGSLATSGFRQGIADEQSSAAADRTQALETTIKQLESEIASLKTGVDRSAKNEAGRFAKVNDRLDKIEKAQTDSAARLTKLQETLDKPHSAAAPAAPTAPAAATAAANVTGSIPVAEPVPLPSPKPGIARLPTVQGWILHDVMDGVALIEGRSGVYEVRSGDPVPGLGRVDAIRKQDGRWVVVTSRGLIGAR